MRELITSTGEALRTALKAASDAGREVLVRRALSAEVKAGGGTRVMDFVASTDTVDRYGDSIDQTGWSLEAFRRNPVILSEMLQRMQKYLEKGFL